MRIRLLAIIAVLTLASPALAETPASGGGPPASREQLETRNSAVLKSNEGVGLLGKGKYQEAIARFDEAIAIDPTYNGAYVNRSIARIRLKQYDEAVADCTKAIASGHKAILSTAYGNRGVAYFYQKKMEPAVADLTKAIELNSKAVLSLNTRAACYFDMGKKELALADANGVLKLEPANVDAKSMIKLCNNQARVSGTVERKKLKEVNEEFD